MKIDTYTNSLDNFTPFVTPITPILEQPAATTAPIIAQQFEDNFFERSGDILGGFVESGQVWALLIGLALGYVIRGITTY